MRGGIWQAVARRPPRGTIVPSANTASTTMITTPDYRALLDTAIEEARTGLSEGGIPIGAALYPQDGRLLGCGHHRRRSEEHTSELQSLMRISYAVFCWKKKKSKTTYT